MDHIRKILHCLEERGARAALPFMAVGVIASVALVGLSGNSHLIGSTEVRTICPATEALGQYTDIAIGAGDCAPRLVVVANLFLFFLSLILVTKSAEVAIRNASSAASGMGLSRYALGFLVVAFISVLPETAISISAALQGTPSFGLGTLIGSNVADLSLVFALVALAAPHAVTVETKVLRSTPLLLGTLAVPLVLGFDGSFGRFDGILLVATGIAFYVLTLRGARDGEGGGNSQVAWRALFFLLVSVLSLLLFATLTVRFGVALAGGLSLDPVLIGMFFVALGTTLPELFFSIRAVRDGSDGLALGDIFGTVVTDATIIVGILALITPFSFDRTIILLTGGFMFISAAFALFFMHTGRLLSRREGLVLILLYIVFVMTELTFGSRIAELMN